MQLRYCLAAVARCVAPELAAKAGKEPQPPLTPAMRRILFDTFATWTEEGCPPGTRTTRDRLLLWPDIWWIGDTTSHGRRCDAVAMRLCAGAYKAEMRKVMAAAKAREKMLDVGREAELTDAVEAAEHAAYLAMAAMLIVRALSASCTLKPMA